MTVTWRTSFYTPNFPGLPAFGQTWPDPNTGQTWTYGLSGWQNPSNTTTATNLTIDNSGNAPDQNFGNVTMLLRMDGAIGSQTFTDSSLNALTISVFGSAQIADQYKRSGNGSGYFNGNGSYLTNSTRLAYAFYDKDFTIEGWFRATSSSGNQTLFSIGSYSDGILLRRSDGVDKLYINGTSYDYDLNFFPVDTWVHVALTRGGGVINLWINGISRLTFTDTSSVAPSGPMAIAASVDSGYQENFAGYIDDFRITLGTCRYSGIFTPSDSTQDGKAAFDPIRLNPESWWDISDSETVVLSGSKISQWKDKTPNRYHLSQSDNSLRPTYLQSQIKTKPVADWGPGQNNIYMSTGTLAQYVTVREMYCVLKYETIGDTFLNYPGIVNPYSNIGWTTLAGSGAYSAEWTPWEYYINGNETSNRANDLFDEIKDTTLIRIKAPAGVQAQQNIMLGMDRFYTNYGRSWRGYFCEILLFSSPLGADQRKLLTDHLRAKWGIRRDVFFAYTSLLLHMNAPVDSNTIVDSSSNSFSITRFGNAELSDELFKFGCSALSLNGANGYIETQASSKFLLGTGDFTVECWVYTSSANTRNGLFQFGQSGLKLYIEDGNWHLAPTNSVGVQMGEVVPDVWQHIAVIRDLNVVRMFVNGSQVGTDLDYTGIALSGNQLRIGTCSSGSGARAGGGAGYVFSFTQDDWAISGDFSPSVPDPIGSFIGKIDEFRVTKGVCRYGRNSFAVPSSPFRSS